jgi:hypothetical protein
VDKSQIDENVIIITRIIGYGPCRMAVLNIPKAVVEELLAGEFGAKRVYRLIPSSASRWTKFQCSVLSPVVEARPRVFRMI